MSTKCRSDILRAYLYFSPASIDVIARLEHMEQIYDLDSQCHRLCEDGLLCVSTRANGITEFQLTDTGKTMQHTCLLAVPMTKYSIYRTLRLRENQHAETCHQVHALIISSQRFLCITDIYVRLHHKITIPYISTVLCRLLHQELLFVCGPLYGTRVNSMMEKSDTRIFPVV